MDSRGYTVRLIHANKTANGKHPGVRLGKFCIEKDIPVRDVAEWFGVSRMTIYKWFTGEWHPRRPHVEKIEQVIKA